MAAFIALGAACAFGLAHILVRRGLIHGSSTTAITINIVSMAAFVWLALGPWGSWEAVSPAGVAWLMLAGAVAPLSSQFLFYASMPRVGVARAASLRNTTPLFASLLAILFLGESWSVTLAGGTIMIIAGATLLSARDSGELLQFRKRDLLLPLGAALLGGLASPMRKYGLSLLPSFPLVVCVTLVGSLAGLGIALSIRGNYKSVELRPRTILWFGLSGVATGCGISLYLFALDLGQVVLVEPLVATSPLFSLLLTHLFLRRHETVTARVVSGALAICAGAALIVAIKSWDM